MARHETLLNANQAAEYLGVSRATFYRWRKVLMLKPKVIGRSKMYKLSDLIKIIK